MYLMQIGWGLERKQYKFQQAYKWIIMVGNVLTKESFQTIQLTEKGLKFFDLASSFGVHGLSDAGYRIHLSKIVCNGL